MTKVISFLVLLLIQVQDNSGGNLTSVYISPFGNDQTGSGTQNNPFETLSKAVSAAKPQANIFFLPGVYSGSLNFPTLNIPLTLQSAKPQGATIACYGGYSGTIQILANITFLHLNFSNCPTMLNFQSSATIIGCVFFGNGINQNIAFTSGALVAEINSGPGVVIVVKDSIFEENPLPSFLENPFSTIYFGNTTFMAGNGPISVRSGSTVSIEHCSFEYGVGLSNGANNYMNNGGAISIYAANCAIANSTFVGNKSPNNGGAISVASGTLTLSYSNFSLNVAPGESGGAIYVAASSVLNAEFCSFNNNTAVTGGVFGCDTSANRIQLSDCNQNYNHPPNNTCAGTG